MDLRIKGLAVDLNIPHSPIERCLVSTDRESSRAEDTCDGAAVGNLKHDYRSGKAAIKTDSIDHFHPPKRRDAFLLQIK